ncbi:MAG: hypothetical protein ABIT08_06040 [Bacteroidia bacterium]
MNSRIGLLILIILTGTLINSCKKDATVPDTASHYLIFKFKFDSTQTRFDSKGVPSTVPSNHSAQSPRFNKMSSHYIELAPNETTQLGSGMVVYKAPETGISGDNAIDFDQSILAGEGETFYAIPLKNVSPGSYKFLRVSLAYQNYDVDFRVTNGPDTYDLVGTIASFIGFNTYIKNYKIKDSTVVVNDDKEQGYWAFEWNNPLFGLPAVSQGQAPPGATTVPNPIHSTSPIPFRSCVVTGEFPATFLLTGNETHDVVITISLSTNKSFEWKENSTPGYFEPLAGDTVVDMGIRGLIPIVN